MLRWTIKHGDLSATGKRGLYSIEQRGIGVKVLQGVGFDGLPLLDLPPHGAVFTTELAARRAADEVDARRTVEPQMSGS